MEEENVWKKITNELKRSDWNDNIEEKVIQPLKTAGFYSETHFAKLTLEKTQLLPIPLYASFVIYDLFHPKNNSEQRDKSPRKIFISLILKIFVSLQANITNNKILAQSPGIRGGLTP
jgi:hypothetical protein